MIASNIGKIFLEAYNEKYNTSFKAKEFFIKYFYEIFFNHNKYMMSAGNSPLENPKISWDKMRKGIEPYESVDKRNDRFIKTIEKIDLGSFDASVAIGYPSFDPNATTSGQVTNLELHIKPDDVYLSWIGSGLGVGVQGGLSLFFYQKSILLDIFEGWKIYRSFLNSSPSLRGNQINTWNGQWISHRYDIRNFNPDNPTSMFNPLEKMADGGLEIGTQSWTKVIIGIARNFPLDTLTSYVYSIGQTNTTIGFIPFNLSKIKRPYELYEKFFGTTSRDLSENLFGTEIGFIKACQMGSIGVNALEPKGFKDCMQKGIMPKYNNDKQINYKTYQIWLLAMLNNEQLWEKAQIIATTLYNYTLSDKNAKKSKSQDVSNLLQSTNKKQFIERLTELIKSESDTNFLLEMGETIHKMPIDNIPYFLTLIRFHFAAINKIS